EARVILQTPDGEWLERVGRASGTLDVWATEVLHAGTAEAVLGHEQRLVARIEDESGQLHGSIALARERASWGGEERRLLAGVAQFVSSCGGGLVERNRALRGLREVHRSLGKGLHDLRTPLNSLRLGLHLLEPALSTQDPAIVQRTNRA